MHKAFLHWVRHSIIESLTMHIALLPIKAENVNVHNIGTTWASNQMVVTLLK